MSFLKDKSIAMAILAFDRPQYLKRCLDSIHNAKGSEDIDIFFFLDGTKDRFTDGVWRGTPYKREKSLRVAYEHPIEFSDIIENEYNMNIVHQKAKCHHLFKQYESMIFMEDDLVIGEDYLLCLTRLHEQFPEALVTMYASGNNGGINEVQHYQMARLWGCMYGQKGWEKIKEGWNRYFEIMENVPYRKRGNALSKNEKGKIASIIDKEEYSHDVAISNLFYNRANGKIRPCTTRAKYIGKEGHYAFTPSAWKRKGMDDQPDVIEYADDPVEEFQLVK